MKKIIALVVAIVMMAAMAVPAFAAGQSYVDNEAVVGEGTKIIYGTTQTYTVEIPAQIQLSAGETSEAQNVTISNYKLAANKRVSITIDSALAKDYYEKTDDAAWYLVEADEKYDPVAKTSKTATDVPYTVYGDGEELARGDVLVYADSSAKVNPDPAVAELSASTVGTSEAANFTDTITFTATVADKPEA